MINFLIIFAAHCFADFPMQGDFISKWKSKSIYVLLCHCAIYTTCMMIGFYIIGYRTGLLETINWEWTAAILFYSHAIIDYIKCSYRNKLYRGDEIDIDVDFDGRDQKSKDIWHRDMMIFLLDQIVHIIIAFAILDTIIIGG